MTGVVASKSVTEASKGALGPIGNRPVSVMAEGRLTGRQTCRAGGKPGHREGPKGWAVRPLKWHASWVQNVVRQFGLYLSRALEICAAPALVREDRAGPTSGLPVVPPGAPPGSRVGIG